MISPKYKDIYEKFITAYKQTSVSPWHEISEDELKNIYEDLVNKMDVDDDYTFWYFMNYIIKRLSGKTDSHSLYFNIELVPLNFKIFNNKVYINYPDDLKCAELVSINGIDISKILDELEDVIIYGTEGKRRYDLERFLFNQFALYGLPSLRGLDELEYKIIKEDGEEITKVYGKNEAFQEKTFNYSVYMFGEDNATYYIDNGVLVYNYRSCQNKYKTEIEESVKRLENEDMSSVNRIIIDLRGNYGGNSNLIKPLINFLKNNSDKELIVLTDYRIFSAGRYALIDLIDLGAVTVGDEISTPINCFGNTEWVDIEGHHFAISNSYFDPLNDIDCKSKEDFEKLSESDLMPHIFKPDVYVPTTLEDYKNDNDAVLDRAINLDLSKENIKSK